MALSEEDGLETALWYAGVQHISGLSSPYKIELALSGLKKFPKNDNGGVRRPRMFDRYKQGRMRPTASTLDRVENRWEGTHEWSGRPFFVFLKVRRKNPLLYQSSTNLRALMRLLNPYVQRQFALIPDEERKAFKYDHSKRTANLIWEGGLDSLTALLILADSFKIALETRQHSDEKRINLERDYSHLSDVIEFVVRRLATTEPYYLIRDKLFTYIRDQFFSYKYRDGVVFHRIPDIYEPPLPRWHLRLFEYGIQRNRALIDAALKIGLIDGLKSERRELLYQSESLVHPKSYHTIMYASEGKPIGEPDTRDPKKFFGEIKKGIKKRRSLWA